MSTKTFEIEIRSHDKESGVYVACYHSPVLGATYSVEFPDSVRGAVALNHFTEMLKSRCPSGGAIRFVLPSDATLQPVLRDVLSVQRNIS